MVSVGNLTYSSTSKEDIVQIISKFEIYQGFCTELDKEIDAKLNAKVEPVKDADVPELIKIDKEGD